MSSATEHKDTTRVAAGLKAAIHNPNVSESAKEQAIAKLKEMGQEVEAPPAPAPAPASTQAALEHDPTRVAAGYKATLSNPYTSEGAKRHAEEVLQASGVHERQPGLTDEEHQTRVLAGYKAALHNPRVSPEAKQHAMDYLKEHGVEVEE